MSGLCVRSNNQEASFALWSNLHFVNVFVLFKVMIDHRSDGTIRPNIQRRFNHVNDGVERKNAVSYTHLTLPTKLEV